MAGGDSRVRGLGVETRSGAAIEVRSHRDAARSAVAYLGCRTAESVFGATLARLGRATRVSDFARPQAGGDPGIILSRVADPGTSSQ